MVWPWMKQSPCEVKLTIMKWEPLSKPWRWTFQLISPILALPTQRSLGIHPNHGPGSPAGVESQDSCIPCGQGLWTHHSRPFFDRQPRRTCCFTLHRMYRGPPCSAQIYLYEWVKPAEYLSRILPFFITTCVKTVASKGRGICLLLF